jgi:hypothetical protein
MTTTHTTPGPDPLDTATDAAADAAAGYSAALAAASREEDISQMVKQLLLNLGLEEASFARDFELDGLVAAGELSRADIDTTLLNAFPAVTRQQLSQCQTVGDVIARILESEPDPAPEPAPVGDTGTTGAGSAPSSLPDEVPSTGATPVGEGTATQAASQGGLQGAPGSGLPPMPTDAPPLPPIAQGGSQVAQTATGDRTEPTGTAEMASDAGVQGSDR